MKTGNTWSREANPNNMVMPQWSPVMKTGNTCGGHWLDVLFRQASMEPGHEDREYLLRPRLHPADRAASLEPGHEDREYPERRPRIMVTTAGLNGARS